MRILLVNKFYYPRGGDCTVLLGTERLLRGHGHDVAVYAMDYAENLPCDTGRYFASEVSFGGSVANRLKALQRTLGMGDVKRSFKALLADFNPEVVHLHNIHSYLSPVLARLASEHGARVVWTMHDYKLVCPAYTMLRGGEPCALCVKGGKSAVVKHRCMKGSLAASAVAWLEATWWNRSALERWVDTLVCPSRFMEKQLLDAGFAPGKVTVLSNFTHAQPAADGKREDYCCYVGRLSPEKGVEQLLDTVSRMPVKLVVAGTGPLEQSLHERYGKCSNIDMRGAVSHGQAQEILALARCSILPAQWHENNPMAVIESLMAGTPVVATPMGGIPELIDDSCGIISPAGELEAALTDAMQRSWDNALIANQAAARFTPEAHLDKLLKIYQGKK